MTQRKVVLTSSSALAVRPSYRSSRSTINPEQAQPATLLSGAKQPTSVPLASRMGTHARNRAPARDVSHPEPRPGASRVRVRTHEEDRAHLNVAAQLDGLLSEMTKAQRRDLLDRLALENQQSKENRDLDMWSEGVRVALEDAIGAQGGEAYGLMLCKRQLGLSSTWRPVESFMRSSGLADLDVVERQAVYNLLARLVVDAAGFSARRSGAPLSLKLAAQHTGQVSGIFERAFPGYLAAGLAPVVARQSLR